MAYTTIDDPSAYFQTATYTGSSSSVTVTNDGNSDLQPDVIWIKRRNGTNDHNIFDTTRGLTERQWPNLNSASDSGSNGISALTDGFTSGTFYGDVNSNGNTFVAWQWKANGGSNTSAGESGSNIGYSRQVNTTSKFMISAYTGTGNDGDTLAHGLGSTPKFWLIKNRGGGGWGWYSYHGTNTSAPETDLLYWNNNDATLDSDAVWDDTAPNSTEIALGTNGGVNADGNTYICYAWAEVQGFSKFGTYTSNGNADGTFVYCGFSPAFIMIKRTDSSGSWVVKDSKLSPFNQANNTLVPNENWAEGTNDYYAVDILSNGFKIRNTNPETGGSGTTNVFMAIAKHPFVSSEGVPCPAR